MADDHDTTPGNDAFPPTSLLPHDHVLDDMLRQVGLEVAFASLPFEPEAGAYTSDAHGHSHSHSH